MDDEKLHVNMIPVIALFGLLIWFIFSEGTSSPIRPRLVSTSSSRRNYE